MTRLGVGIELVGRRREVSALTAALGRAAAGAPTAILMSGDAGVGKSRLVAEAVTCATAAGFTTLTGRCLDAESALPYLPFTEIVSTLAAGWPDLVAAHETLGHLLPGGVARSAPAADRDLGQLRLFDAVLSVLEQFTRDSPALVVLEDLHWADRSSRDLLVFLLSRLGAQRLVVLATYRADDLHRRHPLRPVLSELTRLPAVERLDLQPLGTADTLGLVRLLADGTLSQRQLHSVARRSEGNAFFAEELVSASSDGLPHSLSEVLLARVEGLTPATQRLLRVASVAGRQVSHDQLAAVAELTVDQLEAALREAVHHNVLVTDAAGAEGLADYTFRHALLREAIHDDLLPGERTRLHSAYAVLLATTPDRPGRAAMLAHHALAAHDLPTALAASVRAAREADDREAPAELLFHAERTLELWAAVPDAETVAGEPEYQLTRMAAWAAGATGDPERGIALGRRALDLAEERGDPVVTADLGVLYALRLLELGGDQREAHRVAQQALLLFDPGRPSGSLAWCHAVLARAYYRVDDFPAAVDHAEAALAVVAALPTADTDAQAAAADALVTLANCDEYAGHPRDARRRLAQARALARTVGHLGTELRTYYAVGLSLLEEGRLAEAAAELSAAQDRAAATGLRWSVYGLDVRVAHVIARFLAGDWDTAEESADLAEAAVSASVATRLVSVGLQVAVARGRFDVVNRRYLELAGQPVDTIQAVVFLGVGSAEASLWQSLPDQAVTRVSGALAALDAIEPFSLGGIALSALGIAAHAERAAVGHGDAVTRARELLVQADRRAARGVPRGATLGPEGRAWLARAHAELTRLTGPDPAAWDAVVTGFGYEAATQPTGQPGYRQGYALMRRAEARLLVGGSSGALEDLDAARRTAVRLGAAPLLAAVGSLAVRAGLSPAGLSPAGSSPGGLGSGTPAGDLLTPRELAVLEQVAHGLTNRQVGALLFISEKTVSVHLSRVMSKLDAGSRTEAVSLAYDRGVLAARHQR